jgi:hypothetical protein
MTRTYKVKTKNVPLKVLIAFQKYWGEDAEFNFYWYRGQFNQKIWGSDTNYPDGNYAGNAYQVSERTI